MLSKNNSSSIACQLAYIPDASPSISSVFVSWENGKIAKLESVSPENWESSLKNWKKKSPELRAYKNKLLTPAFINSHTHIAMNLFRGLKASSTSTKGNMIEDLFYHVESKLSYNDVLAFSRMGAYENLFNGVGLVWDHYYYGQAIANALSDVGLTGVVAPTLQDLLGPGKERWEQEWEQTEAIHSNIELKKRGIFAAFGPHASDTCSQALWQKLIPAAKKMQIPIHCHLAQSFEEYERIKQREMCSPVAWLSGLGLFQEKTPILAVHNIFSDKHDLETLSRNKNVTLCFCPFSSLIFALPAATEWWDKHKISWSVGTDCVASNDSMNIQKELRFLAGMPMYNLSRSQDYSEFMTGQSKDVLNTMKEKRKELWDQSQLQRSPESLLDKVWRIPGSIHPQFLAGRIAPQHLANLILWDLDDPSIWPSRSLHTIAMGDSSRAIHQMICNGVFMGEDGQFEASIKRSTKYQEHLQEAKVRYASMLKRASLC